MIKIKDITKIFRIGETELTALKGFTFDIPAGQFLAITGLSGSGKSTLLYQLSLLDTPNKGTISIENINVSEFSSDERITYRLNNLGYIFQDYAILPTLTARENVMMPLLMRGVPENLASKKAEVALVKVDLQD
ncbi:MAG: ATP-binding cassette domain-containing protein, partial [Saprospiraceae bacterium]|nr:ATP-binding cassette domain-containing protein [Saprospiraceae bacterium]